MENPPAELTKTTELTRNYTPGLPSQLRDSAVPLEEKRDSVIGGFMSKIGGVVEKTEASLKPESEIKSQAESLLKLLLDRVEINIDVHRQTKDLSGETGKALTSNLTKNDRLSLIKSGRFREALGGRGERREEIGDMLAKNQAKLAEIETQIREITKNPRVVEEYRQIQAERVAQLRKAKEAWVGKQAAEELNIQEQRMARRRFLENRPYAAPGEATIIQENGEMRKAIEDRIGELKSNPEVFDLVRMRELMELQKGLRKNRFAETPSRKKLINSIREAWGRGEKVLATGPTGGGKTELMKYASQSLFGVSPELVSGHELMTMYEVYGKMGGGIKEGVATILFKAGAAVRALEKNVPLIFDEINLVPNKVLMRMKADFNARVGDRITVQEDSDRELVVPNRYGLGATENVKSEKHPDREKLDPSVVRIFESLPVDYLPANELYDAMVASLMDFRGGLKVSPNDARETLPDLCMAAEWIQNAYQGKTVQINPANPNEILTERGQAGINKPATIQEAVLDPGKVLTMMSGWESARLQGLTFREFLNQRIMGFINNENYPEEDRYHLTRIFALNRFLRGVKAEQLMVPGLDQATLDSWNGYDGKRYASKVNYVPPEAVAQLDPFGVLERPVAADAADLLGEESAEDVIEVTDWSEEISGGVRAKIKGNRVRNASNDGWAELDRLVPESDYGKLTHDIIWKKVTDQIVLDTIANRTILEGGLLRLYKMLQAQGADSRKAADLISFPCVAVIENMYKIIKIAEGNNNKRDFYLISKILEAMGDYSTVKTKITQFSFISSSDYPEVAVSFLKTLVEREISA